MRFHVLALPHTQTSKAYNCCAYTGKTIRFCKMMKDLGHDVFLYASVENDAECTEFISCIRKIGGPEDYLNFPFDPGAEHWKTMNERIIAEMQLRIQPKDFICVIGGRCQQAVADAFPANITVEYGVGYTGVFSRFRVFESYAWMHTIYGALYGADNANGQFYDAVIPNYFDPNEFPIVPQETRSRNYLLYLGRLIDRKGLSIVKAVGEATKFPVVIAGPGPVQEWMMKDNFSYVGVADSAMRADFMNNALATIIPTIYLEPFGGVAIESLLCGTPVISTDWGAFTETITPSDGIRCRTLRDFVQAVELIKKTMAFWQPLWLDSPQIMRQKAVERFGMTAVGSKYQTYFTNLMDLWGKGWYEL